MKNLDVEYYHKFSIVEYSLNIKKFREYLDFLKKNDLTDEKILIFENLISHLNEASLSNSKDKDNVIDSIQNMCVLTIVYADFEVENFFKMPTVNSGFQKGILYQAIDYCLVKLTRFKEHHEYLLNKFQFWVLKLMNINLNLTADFNPVQPISSQELTVALEHLERVVIFVDDKLSKGEYEYVFMTKAFFIKVSYELGYYYFLLSSCYLTSNKEALNKYRLNYKKYFKIALNILHCLDESARNSFAYFEEEAISSLISEKDQQIVSDGIDIKAFFDTSILVDIQKKDTAMVDAEVQILSITSTTSVNESNDLKDIISKVNSIGMQEKQIMDNLSIDDNKTLELFTTEEIIRYSKNMILQAIKDFSKLIHTQIYIKNVEQYCKNNDKKTDGFASSSNATDHEWRKSIKKLEIENYYHNALITLVELTYKKEDKIPNTNFLKNLSKFIITNTLTDDLEISGLLHSYLLNFIQNYNNISAYFKDFMEFFNSGPEVNLVKINQIKFIHMFIRIIDEVKKHGSYSIEGNLHVELINLILLWLNLQKEGKILNKENIIYIMIKAIKNLDYLNKLKAILVEFVKFITDKKTKVSDDEIYDHLHLTNPSIFKISSLIKDESKIIFQDIVNSKNSNKNYHYFNSNLDFLENEGLLLINKIEKKVIKFSNLNEEDYYLKKSNLSFLRGNYSQALLEYISYFQSHFAQFKTDFHKLDLFNDLSKIETVYEEFKILFNDVLLYRLSYCFYKTSFPLEAVIILQYTKRVQYDLLYKYFNLPIEHHNIDKLEFIWKITCFEYLSNIYAKNGKTIYLNTIMELIKRTSNHQYFKKHNLRKCFKIINFFKFLDSYS